MASDGVTERPPRARGNLARSIGLAAPAALVLALSLSLAWFFLDRSLRQDRGLVLEVLAGPEHALPERIGLAAAPTLPTRWQRELPRRFLSLRFSGFWQVDRGGQFELGLAADGAAELQIDGRRVVRRKEEARSRTIRGRIALAPGAHAIELTYAKDEPPFFVKIVERVDGGAPRSLDPWSLYPSLPGESQLRKTRFRHALAAFTGWAWIGALVLVGAYGATRAQTLLPQARRWTRPLAPAALVLIVGYGALLRFEALVVRQWEPEAPAWAHDLKELSEQARPQGRAWTAKIPRYTGDPVSYLRFAREMRGFYDAHVREPLFVATAKRFLRLAGDEDIGISFASAFFSTLLVAATFLLARQAFSVGVAVGAAFGVAAEGAVISLSTEGWRDDAFAFLVVLSTYALLRLFDRPSFATAVLAGLVAGAAALTRLTSLSFLVPLYLYVGLLGKGTRRERAQFVGLSAGLAFIVVAPFLLSCAIAFGDPFYSVNYHKAFYRLRAGLPADRAMGWSEFLSYGRGPFELLDTVVMGLTWFPFANKPFDSGGFWPALGPVLTWSAAAGVFFMWTQRRSVLVVLALLTSLVPYCTTWPTTGGSEWRFTLHAYPFFLIAAWALIVGLLCRVQPATLRRPWPEDRRVAARALCAALLALATWSGAAAVHYLRVREDMGSGKEALLEAGLRDVLFVGSGFGPPERQGAITVRRSLGAAAALILPVDRPASRRILLRLSCPAAVTVRLNGAAVATLDPQPESPRIPSYEVTLPAAAQKSGRNRLVLEPEGAATLVFWYLAVGVPGKPEAKEPGG